MVTIELIDKLEGKQFEDVLKPILEAQDFENVEVTKASRDFGVDLKAKKNNLIYSIQAKRYSKKVGLRAVQEAISGMIHFDYDKSMVVANQEFTEAAIQFAEKAGCELIDRNKLEKWLDKKIRIIPEKIEPKEYQKEALALLNETRAQGYDKALVIMATGLGKTFLVAIDAFNYIKEIPGGKILFIVHQKEILEQAEISFYKIFGGLFTTGFFHGFKKDKNKDILFATFQTLSKKLNDFERNEFDYVIIDESHHSHAATYKPIVEYFQPKFKIGITATPDRKDNLEIANLYDNNTVFELGLADALVKGYLCPVEYWVLTDNINYQNINDGIFKYSIKDLNKKLFIRRRDEEIAKIYYDKIEQIKNAKTIIFCPSIAYAEDIKNLFADSVIVHSRMSRSIRRESIDNFKEGKYKVVLTVDLFNEGVDIPDANVIVFLRSTQSHTIFLQQLGRGLRRFEGKEKVLVLDFVAHEKNLERVRMISVLDELIKKSREKSKDNYKKSKGNLFYELRSPFSLKFSERKFNIVEWLRKRENYLANLKTSGYWNKWENLKSELLPICKDLGSFPSRTYLNKIGKGKIERGIIAHGNRFIVAMRLGYPIDYRKEEGYWKKWQNIEKELLPLCKKYKRFPTTSEIRKEDSSLENAMKYHGGRHSVAEKLGFTLKRKKTGYYDNFENIKTELIPICKKLRKFPTGNYLRKIGKSSLDWAINNFGGAYEVSKKLGYPIDRKPDKYWEEKENVIQEIKVIVEELNLGDKFPSRQDLIKANKRNLERGIQKHGGTHKLAKELNLKVGRIKEGEYDDFENLKKELLPICKKLGKMPSQEYFIKKGQGYLKRAIQKHGGSYSVAKILGYKIEAKPPHYWNNWKNLENELLPICKTLKKFPSRENLKKLGKSHIESGINVQGGRYVVAKKLGYLVKRKKNGYWNDFNNLKKELLEIIKTHGRFPERKLLENIGRSDIVNAIKKHGGVEKVKHKLK